MKLEGTIHKSIHAVDAAEWDEIVGKGRVFQTHAALAFLEEGGLADCPPKYFILRTEDGQIAAHVAAYMIETSLVIFSQGIMKAVVDKIRIVLPKFLFARILECSCPVSLGNPLSLRKGVDFADVVKPLCEALDQVAAEAKIRLIVLRDFLEGDLRDVSSLNQQGFSQIQNLPTTELQVRWKSFDEYLASMRSRHRYKVRRGLRLAKRSGLTSRFLDEFSEMSEQLARQWKNVNEHAKEYSREMLTPDFYRGVGPALGSNCRLLEVLKGEQLMAHALIVLDGATLRWLFFGREEGGSRDGAFFLAIAQIIEFGIAKGVAQIEMGLTTYSSKTDFGARMVPLWMFIRVRAVLIGRLLTALLRLFNPVPDVRQRDVFNPTKAS